MAFISIAAKGDKNMESDRIENPRVVRTHGAIQKAFRELILEGRTDEINVKRIAELAGIHRKTFYLHYTCIEDLYSETINRIMQEYAKEVEKLPMPYDYYDLTRVMFDFYTADPFTEKIITDSRYQAIASEILYSNLRHNRSAYNPFAMYTEEEQELINIFLAGASTDVYRQWVAGGKKVPMDKVIQIIGNLLENGVSSMREKNEVYFGEIGQDF